MKARKLTQICKVQCAMIKFSLDESGKHIPEVPR